MSAKRWDWGLEGVLETRPRGRQEGQVGEGGARRPQVLGDVGCMHSWHGRAQEEGTVGRLGEPRGLPAKRGPQPQAISPLSQEHLLRNTGKAPGSQQWQVLRTKAPGRAL